MKFKENLKELREERCLTQKQLAQELNFSFSNVNKFSPLRLKKIRQLNNFTQEDIAKMLGISRVCYCRYENGQRKISIKILYKLADIFNLSIDFLVGRKKY